jgi:hypothetical protein
MYKYEKYNWHVEVREAEQGADVRRGGGGRGGSSSG